MVWTLEYEFSNFIGNYFREEIIRRTLLVRFGFDDLDNFRRSLGLENFIIRNYSIPVTILLQKVI